MGKIIFIIAILMLCATGIVGTLTKLDYTVMGSVTVLLFMIAIFTMMFEAD
jgi:hypothetical protein